MTTTTPARDCLSLNEFRSAVEAMTVADWIRLGKISHSYSRDCQLEADDLLQMALLRALEGTRRCPRRVDVLYFLSQTMRSIASGDKKARKRKPMLHLVPRDSDGRTVERDILDPQPSAEIVLEAKQARTALLAQVLALFEDDVIAQTIIEGEVEEMEAHELRDLTGLDPTAYASKRRLIRRRIDKSFPRGWNR